MFLAGGAVSGVPEEKLTQMGQFRLMLTLCTYYKYYKYVLRLFLLRVPHTSTMFERRAGYFDANKPFVASLPVCKPEQTCMRLFCNVPVMSGKPSLFRFCCCFFYENYKQTNILRSWLFLSKAVDTWSFLGGDGGSPETPEEELGSRFPEHGCCRSRENRREFAEWACVGPTCSVAFFADSVQ